MHVAHQHGGHAIQTEGADSAFVLATEDAKRRLVLVFLADPELIWAMASLGRKVERGEESRAALLVHELSNDQHAGLVSRTAA